MDTETKLNAHLEHIVMPKDVPMTAKEILELCDRATREQRMAALLRATIRNPLILDDEMSAAFRWANQI